MPSDQLSSDDSLLVSDTAVLAVLAGTAVDAVAAQFGLSVSELDTAVEIYRSAGRAALHAHAAANHDWYQAHVEFAEWTAAESTAIHHLAPHLSRLHRDGELAGWWFIRKHPCWRVRVKPRPNAGAGHAGRAVARILDDLSEAGTIASWRQTIYEPEQMAFGGPAGIEIAHALFCADTVELLRYLRSPSPAFGRREISILLCRALMTSAGLEWYEQGDAWHRISRERPVPADVPESKLVALATDLRRLLYVDLNTRDALCATAGWAPFADVLDWVNAFRDAGEALGHCARAGKLQRGIRDVLSYLVLFHWNRIGLSARTQSILADAALRAIISA